MKDYMLIIHKNSKQKRDLCIHSQGNTQTLQFV